MTQRRNFTDKWLRSVGAPASGRAYHYDDRQPGLELVVTEKGHKSFFTVYRCGTTTRRMKIGPFPTVKLATARDEARNVMARVTLGDDPAAAKQQARAAVTFADVAKEFLEKHARRKNREKSWREAERILFGSKLTRKGKTRHVPIVEVWGNRKLTDIKRADVRSLLEDKAETAPVMANRVLACISPVFTFALEREWIEANPCARLKKPSSEKARERVLSADEIRIVWTGLDEEDPLIAALVRVQLLTGQRPGEVREMQWAEVDLDRGVWTIPSERSKNRLLQRVPLTAPVREILRDVRKEVQEAQAKRAKRTKQESTESLYVFPSAKKHYREPIRNAQKAIQRIRKRTSVTFTFHDLRTTVATHMAEAGVLESTIDKVLNHKDGGVTRRHYNFYAYDAEKRTALETWARKLDAILHGRDATNVLPFARR